MVEKNQQRRAETEPPKEWGFSELQQRVKNIYEEHDIECGYGPDTMLAKLVGNVTTLTHAARKTPDDLKTIGRSLTNVLIWTTTIANIANIDLQEIMQEKFGAGCPHCKLMPCLLSKGEKCEEPSQPSNKPKPPLPSSMEDWQKHLKIMYSNNFQGDLTQALRFCSNRTLEEAGELIGSTYREIEEELKSISFDPVMSSSFKSEIADLVAWTMAVANCLDVKNGYYSLEASLKEKYKEGCPYCKSPKCNCPKAKTFIEELKK